jgi:hypothetical protein
LFFIFLPQFEQILLGLFPNFSFFSGSGDWRESLGGLGLELKIPILISVVWIGKAFQRCEILRSGAFLTKELRSEIVCFFLRLRLDDVRFGDLRSYVTRFVVMRFGGLRLVVERCWRVDWEIL